MTQPQWNPVTHRHLALAFAVLGLGLVGCNKTGVPTAYSEMCTPGNNKKILEVPGFLHVSGFTMCSKRGREPMRCSVQFKETAGSESSINVDVPKGSGSNEIEAAKEGTKIRDDNSVVVDLSRPLKVTGRIHVFDVPNKPNGGCYLTVTKLIQ